MYLRSLNTTKSEDKTMTMIRSLLAASVLAASIGAAQAQTPPAAPAAPMAPMPAGMPMGTAGGHGMGGGDMGKMMEGMMPMMGMMRIMMAPEHVEGHIACLRTEIQITDAQLPQWNAFADVLRKNAKVMSEARGKMMPAATAMSAPDRMDQEVKKLTEQLEATKATSAATRALYTALTDVQKKTADELLVPAMGRM